VRQRRSGPPNRGPPKTKDEIERSDPRRIDLTSYSATDPVEPASSATIGSAPDLVRTSSTVPSPSRSRTSSTSASGPWESSQWRAAMRAAPRFANSPLGVQSGVRAE
jgi:hypothetical protein